MRFSKFIIVGIFLFSSSYFEGAFGSDSSLEDIIEAEPPVKTQTLLLDGGGLRGIAPASILGKMETDSGKKIHEMFPCGITGTSTGALLAAALSCSQHRNIEGGRPNEWISGPYPAQVIADFYERHGGHIFNDAFVNCVSGPSCSMNPCCHFSLCGQHSCFHPSCSCGQYSYQCNGLQENCCSPWACLVKTFCCMWTPCCSEKQPQELIQEDFHLRGCCESVMRCLTCSNNGCGLCGPRYTNTVLRSFLDYYFGNLTLSDVVVPLQIVAYKVDGNQHEPTYFQGYPGCSSRVSLADACTASAAAPTFFPPKTMEGKVYIDGGIFENSAGFSALRFALIQYQRTKAPGAEDPKLTDFTLLSVGTGAVEHPQNFAQRAQKGGLYFWANQAIEISIAGAAQASHRNLEKLYDCANHPMPRYFRLQFYAPAEKLTMDTAKNLVFLKDQALKLCEGDNYAGLKRSLEMR